MSCMMYASPIGQLVLHADAQGLCGVRLLEAGRQVPAQQRSPLLEEAAHQLEAYFAGKRTAFDLPLSMRGSAFDRAVWAQLLEIAYGEVRTYGQIAAQLGKPGASRAVGGACSRNPLLIIVPCHRVLAGTGKLTGFAAGMQAKRALLAREGWLIEGDRIQMK